MSPQLIHQRVRNRIAETLEWVLESWNTPPALGFNSLINYWNDWAGSPVVEDDFPAPVYTKEEVQCLRKVSEALDVFCNATPPSIEDEIDTLALPEWMDVVSTARQAHAEIMKRGRFSEEQELAL